MIRILITGLLGNFFHTERCGREQKFGLVNALSLHVFGRWHAKVLFKIFDQVIRGR